MIVREKLGISVLNAFAQTFCHFFNVGQIVLSFFHLFSFDHVADVDVDRAVCEQAIVLAQNGVVINVSFFAACSDEMDDVADDFFCGVDLLFSDELVECGVDQLGFMLEDEGDLV